LGCFLLVHFRFKGHLFLRLEGRLFLCLCLFLRIQELFLIGRFLLLLDHMARLFRCFSLGILESDAVDLAERQLRDVGTLLSRGLQSCFLSLLLNVLL